LRLDKISEQPSFLFIWAGNSDENLENARKLIKNWGYRRCEDIVWIKTNKKIKNSPEHGEILVRTKEHCLVGIKGTV
jgi:N6-adenosine-specific RNA methylase IME4